MSKKYNSKDIMEVIAKQMSTYKINFEEVWTKYVPEEIKAEFLKDVVLETLKDEFDELFLSPLPWKVFSTDILDSEDNHIAQFEKFKDVAYAIKCIYMHEELISLMKEFKYLCETGIEEFEKDVLVKRVDDILKREASFESL